MHRLMPSLRRRWYESPPGSVDELNVDPKGSASGQHGIDFVLVYPAEVSIRTSHEPRGHCDVKLTCETKCDPPPQR